MRLKTELSWFIWESAVYQHVFYIKTASKFEIGLFCSIKSGPVDFYTKRSKIGFRVNYPASLYQIENNVISIYFVQEIHGGFDFQLVGKAYHWIHLKTKPRSPQMQLAKQQEGLEVNYSVIIWPLKSSSQKDSHVIHNKRPKAQEKYSIQALYNIRCLAKLSY